MDNMAKLVIYMGSNYSNIASAYCNKQYLPFGRRLKYLQPFIEDMKLLYLKMEYDWYKVAAGELSETEINGLLYSYKKEYSGIESKYLKEEILVENVKYKNKADIKTEEYFKNNF